jgi:hypothetical protein
VENVKSTGSGAACNCTGRKRSIVAGEGDILDLMTPPLRGANLNLERLEDYPRIVEIE